MRGQGTFNDPYLVETVADFVSMSGYGTGVYFELANDIDFGSTTYTDNVIDTFRGIFDGKFHKLLNFKTSGPVYLIRYIQGDANHQAVFKNVGIENISMDSRSRSFTNGPLGYINGPGVVEKVYVTGTITNTMNVYSTELMGTLLEGITATTGTALVQNCYSMVDVVLPNVEELLPDSKFFIYSHQYGEVKNCCFFGSVTIKSGYSIPTTLSFGVDTSEAVASGNYVDKERGKLTITSEPGVTYYTTAQALDFATNYPTLDRTIWSKDNNINYGYPFIRAFNFPKSWETTVRSPLSSSGYQDIRDMVQANWTHIQLSRYDGTPIIRLNCEDPRVAWTHNPGDQVLELTITLKGSDVDYEIPNTFGLIELYKSDSGGVPLTHDLFTPQSISTVSDTLYLKYRIQIPRVK